MLKELFLTKKSEKLFTFYRKKYTIYRELSTGGITLDFLIRRMSQGDVPFVAEIEKECFSSPWSEQGLFSELSNEQAYFYVLEAEGTVAAYMGMHIILDECYITNVAVKGSFRRRGFAEALVKNAISVSEEKNCCFITLEVRKSNEKAISLYSKCGFENLGERKDFYTEPKENAYIMTKYTETKVI